VSPHLGLADPRLLQSWHDEICAFFVAWHTPTLEAEFRRFFTMTTLEKMNVPLSSLSVYLMICALGKLLAMYRA
jgi:hypothetical protein